MKLAHKVIFVLAVIGLIASIYSLVHHFEVRAGIKSTLCDITPGLNCDIVSLSPYSEIFGIPLPIMGIFWFLVIFALLFLERLPHVSKYSPETDTYLIIWSGIGLLFVLWLVFAEVFLIGSICLVCTLVHIITLAIFIIAKANSKKSIRKMLKEFMFETNG